MLLLDRHPGYALDRVRDSLVGDDRPIFGQRSRFIDDAIDSVFNIYGAFNPESLPVATLKKMRKHPTIRLGLSVFKAPIYNVNWWIDGHDKRIAAAVEENLKKVWGNLIQGMLRAMEFGYAPFEKVFTVGPLRVEIL
jgi:hypothetical protein